MPTTNINRSNPPIAGLILLLPKVVLPLNETWPIKFSVMIIAGRNINNEGKIVCFKKPLADFLESSLFLRFIKG
jgi:hypothetical protein